MKDELKTVKMIQDKSENVEFDRELKIRELVRIIPHTFMGTVKSLDKEGELTGRYSVFFKNHNETKGLQKAIDDKKTVLVTIKEIGNRWGVIKSEIRKPNAEIKEPTLEEQKKETKAFADY